MAKIRVGQLAKELNLKVGDLLTRLHQMGVEAKTNLSTVDDEIAAKVRSAGPSIAEPAAAKPKAKAPAKTVVTAVSEAAKTPLAKPASSSATVTPPVATKGTVRGHRGDRSRR